MKKILVLVFFISSVFVNAASFDCKGSNYRVIVNDRREMDLSGNGLNIHVRNVLIRPFLDIEYYATVEKKGVKWVVLRVSESSTSMLTIEKKYSTVDVAVECTKI